MKRASYREAVEYIALNDNSGSDDALDVIEVASMISVDLIAFIFRIDLNKVAQDVIKVRLKEKR